MSIIRFFKYNRHKSLTIMAYIYSAVFRMCILFLKPDKFRRFWGEEGKESKEDLEMDGEKKRMAYRYVRWVAFTVEHTCSKTKWESKCLVRALTAQKLLRKKQLPSTLYLGCRTEEGKMVAHAWLRCGRAYVTGGDGKGYAVVDRFYST